MKEKILYYSVLVIIVAFIIGGVFILNFTNKDINNISEKQSVKNPNNNISDSSQIQAKVLPKEGYNLNIKWKDLGLKLVNYGVIDLDKFSQLYSSSKPEIFDILTNNSNKLISINNDNGRFVLNVLWGFGLANKLKIMESSPIIKSGYDISNFASTGGWTIGKEKNGGVYFNKFEILKLTQGQELLVKKIAENIFRPCCDNTTFFPDCNHGIALLGLIEIMAANNFSESDIYKAALAFNSFWFPDQYIKIAMYFEKIKDIKWENIDPKLVLSKEYSSGSGFMNNIDKPLKDAKINTDNKSGGGCGV